MTDQYFAAEPGCESNPVSCAFTYRGHCLRCETDAGVFSRGELDDGSRLLLDALPPLTGDVADMGCGWGPIGIAIARANPDCRVVMADVNRRALTLAEKNAAANGVTARVVESDGFAALMDCRFDAVVTNPPIRAGKQVIYSMFADAAKVLRSDGSLYLVIRKQQGADSCRKYLKTLFEQVEVLSRDNGFRVFQCTGILNDGQKE